MEIQKIEYTTKSKINLEAIKSFTSDALKERFENVDKYKPLILRIRIDDSGQVHLEDFDYITIENIRRVAGYELSKELEEAPNSFQE